MPQMTSKIPQSEKARFGRDTATGQKGAAVSPPRYGIDFVDSKPEQKANTSLPERLKTGIETLSGLGMNDVRVHYNSSKPAQVQALAYTQGTEIHVGPEQEKHLAHEAWHVVQQKQGRVKPALQTKGVEINDDTGLEGEAKVMGRKASQVGVESLHRKEISGSGTVQTNSSLISFSQANLSTLQLQRIAESTVPDTAAKLGESALQQAKENIKMMIEEARKNPETGIPALYLVLKQTRRQFPTFTEKDFLGLTASTQIFSEEMRKAILSRDIKYKEKSIKQDDRRIIWAESNKPLAGYVLSGFEAVGGANVFTPLQGRLGSSLAPEHKTGPQLVSEPPESTQDVFSGSDILVFTGHQYAQYKAPGVWNDNRGFGWDIRKLQGPIDRVKVIISTSCATLCREAVDVWTPLFPNAVILDYRRSAPRISNLASDFANRLPKDMFIGSGNVSQIISAWKSAVQIYSGQPGWLEISSGRGEYWNGKRWMPFDG